MAVEIDGIPGLFFTPEVLTETQEAALLENLKYEPGKPVIQIHPACEFGWPFRPRGPPLTLDDSYGIMPAWLEDAWSACVAAGSMPPCVPRHLPDHVLANTYPVGDGCARHTDDKSYWTDFVVGLSLGSGATIEFQRGVSPPVSVYLPQRSMYVLTGAARWDFTHAVTAAAFDDVEGVRLPRFERVSFTFRNINGLQDQLARPVRRAPTAHDYGDAGLPSLVPRSAFGSADDDDRALAEAIEASMGVGGGLWESSPAFAAHEGEYRAAAEVAFAVDLAAALAASGSDHLVPRHRLGT